MRKILGLVLALVLVLGFTTSAISATSVTLQWTAPTTNVDSTLITDLAGFKIYCGKSTGSYTVIKDVGLLTATATGGQIVQYSTTGMLTTSGTWYCIITAYDTLKLESGYSNERFFPLDFNIAPASIKDLILK